MGRTAVLGTDLQKDFCPGGALPIKNGDDIIEPFNELLNHADSQGWLVLLSRCLHPRKTNHFIEFGGKWPVHCVQDTPGAEFHDSLEVDVDTDIIISKAMQPDEDGYSPLCANAFVADGRTAVQFLEDEVIDRLYVGGLATDVCVLAGVLDALKLPFIKEVYLLTDAIGAVDINPGDGQRAIDQMVAAGAILTTVAAIIGAEA